MKRDLPVRAKVRCADGEAGTSEGLIVDPVARRVTDMVLRDRHSPYTERLVPVDLIASTTEEEIRLGCSLADIHNLENFVETQFLKPPEDRTVPSDPLDSPPIYLWPYAYPNENVLVTTKRIPPGELEVRRNTEVDATNGPVGRVEAFLVDPADEHITHVVVRSGHLARREYAVPVSEMSGISEDRLQLRLDRRAVEALPHVPYHEISLLPGVQGVDRELLPEFPAQAGVSDVAPDMAHLEAAHVLAQEARVRLESRAFTYQQILDWAKDYLGTERSGGVDEFISWIGRKEHAS